MRGPTHRTAHARGRAKRVFLKHLAASCNVSESARVAGVARSTAHDWKAADSEFSDGWDDAIEVARDALEAEARRRAMEGWQEPIYQGGKKVGTIRRYSDRMLEVLLKGHKPMFRDRSDLVLQVPQPRPDDVTDIEAARSIAFVLEEGRQAVLRQKRSEPEEVLALPAPRVYREVDRRPRPEEKPAIEGQSKRVVHGDRLRPEGFNAEEQGLAPRPQQYRTIGGRRR